MVQRIEVAGLVVRDRVGEGATVRAVAERLFALPDADPRAFERVTLSPKRVGVLHGRCRFPVKQKSADAKGYVVTAAVRADSGTFPAGVQHWGALRDRGAKQGWRSGPVLYGFKSRSHATAFVLAHEFAHVALREKWLARKNTEAMVNAVALDWCSGIGLAIRVEPVDRRRRVMTPETLIEPQRQRSFFRWF